MKTVSVVIPSYNRAALIRRAIESVESQSYPQILQIIVVDDGSSDNTEQVVRALRDPRIEYIRLDRNRGACHARNRGIEAAKGELVAFLDSDDHWLPEKLDKQVAYMERTGADACFHAFERIDPDSQGLPVRIPEAELPSGRIRFEDLIPANRAGTPTLVFTRACIARNLFDESMPRFQDWELMLRLCLRGYKVFFLNEVLLVQEVQHDSISMDFERGYAAYARLFTLLSEEYKKEKNRRVVSLWRRALGKARRITAKLREK